MRSSEGVQVGGVRSSYGCLGTWTTVLHDIHDPVGKYPPTLVICERASRHAGPFLMRKIQPGSFEWHEEAQDDEADEDQDEIDAD